VPDSAFAAVTGVTLVEGDAWRTGGIASDARDVVILGLKELPTDRTDVYSHTHVYFAHCFKNQHGWQDTLARFSDGGGTLLDLEFLTDDSGRRVAAFGRSAGFVGAAVGLLAWAHAAGSRDRAALAGPLAYYADYDALVLDVRKHLDQTGSDLARPSVHVIGALGRCGRGAVECAERAGCIDVRKWDMAETAKGGPFPELLTADILLNAILLDAAKPPPPFVTTPMLDVAEPPRRCSVLVDVSCDGNNPTNPVPLYTTGTTFLEPVTRIRPASDAAAPFDVISIDHLPSLVPLESSREFAALLLPSLLALAPERTPVWQRAEQLFKSKTADAGLDKKRAKTSE
jgi:saccharopine dehydrogenase (NAD+, L-lysine-forming)